MRKTLTAAFFGVMFASALQAAPPMGVYQTERGDTGGFLHVKMGPCAKSPAKACGTIMAAYDKNNAKRTDYEHVGKPIVWDMAERSDGSFAGGKIWAPDRDKTYRSKMSVSGGGLKVSGCVGPFCRSQSWQKLK